MHLQTKKESTVIGTSLYLRRLRRSCFLHWRKHVHQVKVTSCEQRNTRILNPPRSIVPSSPPPQSQRASKADVPQQLAGTPDPVPTLTKWHQNPDLWWHFAWKFPCGVDKVSIYPHKKCILFYRAPPCLADPSKGCVDGRVERACATMGITHGALVATGILFHSDFQRLSTGFSIHDPLYNSKILSNT